MKDVSGSLRGDTEGWFMSFRPQIPRFTSSNYPFFNRVRDFSVTQTVLQDKYYSKAAALQKDAEIKKPLSENRSARNQLWGMIKGFITRSTDPFDLWYVRLGFPTGQDDSTGSRPAWMDCPFSHSAISPNAIQFIGTFARHSIRFFQDRHRN